jgi:hypothetical protein
VGATTVGREVVVVGGTPEEARRYAEGAGVDVRLARRPGELANLDPSRTHIAVLPGIRALPAYLMVQVEIELLKRHGATVEWA